MENYVQFENSIPVQKKFLSITQHHCSLIFSFRMIEILVVVGSKSTSKYLLK